MVRALTKHAVNTRHAGDHTTGYLIYHQTKVVSWDPEQIRLDTGGWRSVTTKTRMNQAAHEYGLGFCVFAEKRAWFVCVRRPGTDTIDWENPIPFDERALTISRR